MSGGRIHRSGVLILLLLVMFPYPGMALDYRLNTSAGTDVRWSDNIEGESTGKKSDFYFTPFISFELEGRGRVSSLSTSGSFRGEFYTRHDELNDFSVPFPGINGTYRTKITEKIDLSLSAHGSYEPNSTESSETLVINEGGAGVPVTTTITGRTDRYAYGGSGAINYRFTPRLSTTIDGSYSTTQYTRDIGDLSDERSYSVGASLSRQMTHKLSLGFSSLFSKTDFDEGNDSEVIRGEITADYSYTPLTSFYLRGGASSSDAKNEERETNLTGSAGFRTSVNRTSIVVDLSRSVSGRGSSFGRITRRDNGRVALSSPLFRRGRYTLTGNVTHNVSRDDQEDNVIIGATLHGSYPVLKYVSITFSGRTSHQDARGILGDNIDINEVAVGFVINHTY